MAVPHLDDIRQPALKLLSERGSLTRVSEVFELLAPSFDLTPADLHEMLPSGTQRKWHNRVNWPCFDLYKAGLLERPKKGWYQINAQGKAILGSAPARLSRKILSDLSPEFANFLTPSPQDPMPGPAVSPVIDEVTPDETIAQAVATLDQSLRSELLDQLGKIDPFRFEQVVIDLLFAMGYGGSREEAARVTQRSNDEGIDGVINEDRLGLDVIYVQAKRWKSSIGRPEIQSFVGALAGKQAHKGVFITTSSFGSSAIDYAAMVPQKIILIDGARLASLMIEHNIGVSITRTIALKRIDSDYFEEG